jgi:hypothetical protein
MEPTIIAAVVTASGGLLSKMIEWASKSNDDAHKKATKVIGKTYDVLKGNLTDGAVRVLKFLEDGRNRMLIQLRQSMYPALNLAQNEEGQFNHEFRYRMEYLRLNGVVSFVGGSEYAITRLGQAFLEEARRRRDYPDVLP